MSCPLTAGNFASGSLGVNLLPEPWKGPVGRDLRHGCQCSGVDYGDANCGGATVLSEGSDPQNDFFSWLNVEGLADRWVDA